MANATDLATVSDLSPVENSMQAPAQLLALMLALSVSHTVNAAVSAPFSAKPGLLLADADNQDDGDDEDDGDEDNQPAPNEPPPTIEINSPAMGITVPAIAVLQQQPHSATADDKDNAEEDTPPLAVAQPYYSLGMSGGRSENRNGPPDYHINSQAVAMQAVLPIGHAFGTRINAAYGRSDISLPSPCGNPSSKAGSVQGFWSNPDLAKLGISIGRSVNGNCVAESDAYNSLNLIGEYYFEQGWVGASATYTRATAMRSVSGEDSDEYVLSGEWQPEKFTISAHLKRLLQQPIQPPLLQWLTPAHKVSGNYGDIGITAYPVPDVALNLTTGQPLHYSDNTQRTGSTQFSARWQPTALGQNLELALRGDINHDSRGIVLGVAYYFNNRSSLINRDRLLRF